jgi:hypothetical protein
MSTILKFMYYGTPYNVKKIRIGDLIERVQTIAELVISPYPAISQQLLGFKKLSFVGDYQLNWYYYSALFQHYVLSLGHMHSHIHFGEINLLFCKSLITTLITSLMI